MSELDTIIWAVVLALAFIGEMVTLSFFLIFFSFGAAVALLISFAGTGVISQLAGFVAASLISMALLRPALVNRLSLGGGERYERHKGIVGRSAVVTEEIEPGSSGMVRIGRGEFWTARALHPGMRIEEGTRVRVLDSDGLTAFVEPLEENGEGEA
ncbi:MAG: NfeD family protein [Rubrobacteraceae bacterium]|uniref:NfeD family protein n=1 Tax=Rubrobacter naiadicus TaxID=1392641 RepID=UPI00235F5D6B|nr:NfeD family protein [Rubrobacter naiadicus]MBX6763874.1 NfeD family protein [Rubrobacteraceae bacterium]MCL6437716.1 NfeD family protein [Rubrobacteraceae bacterium]